MWCHMPVTWPRATERAVVATLCLCHLLRTLLSPLPPPPPLLPPRDRSKVQADFRPVTATLAALVVLALWPATNQDLHYPPSLWIVTAHWASLASLNRVLTSITSRHLCNLMFDVLIIVACCHMCCNHNYYKAYCTLYCYLMIIIVLKIGLIILFLIYYQSN